MNEIIKQIEEEQLKAEGRPKSRSSALVIP